MDPGIMVHTISPSTQEAEEGKSLWVQRQPDLDSKFQTNRGKEWTFQNVVKSTFSIIFLHLGQLLYFAKSILKLLG